MKKTLPILFLGLASFANSVCAQNVQKNDVLGSYKGSLVVTLGGEDTPMDDVQVFAEDQDDTHFKLTLKDFSFPVGDQMVNIGDIEIPDVQVKTDGTLNAPTTVIDKSNLGLGQLPTTTNGTMDGAKADLKLVVTWLVYPIDVVYKGTKLTSGLTSVSNDLKIKVSKNLIEVSGATVSSFAIYGINGVAIANGTTTTNLIPLNNLAAGIYMVQLNTANGIVTKKFIIK